MVKRVLALLLLLGMLSGCWSRLELNDLGLILGIALDKGEKEGTVRLAIFMPRPVSPQQRREAGASGGSPALVMSKDADNISDALALMRTVTARQLGLDHMRVVLVGEEYARSEGMADLLNVLATNPEVRMTTYVFVVQGTAWEVFATLPELRTLQPMNLMDIIQAKGAANWRLKNMLVARTSGTHSMWTHAIKVVGVSIQEPGSPPTAVVLSGAALFEKDRLVRFLNENEAQLITWFLGNPRDSIITSNCANGKPGTVSAQVERATVKIDPRLNGDDVSFHVRVNAELDLRRSECTADWVSRAGRRQMEERMEEDLRTRFEEFIAILQESGVDPVGFGHRLRLAYPAYFRELGQRWLEVWPTASVSVTARVKIVRSGLTDGPANRSEHQEKGSDFHKKGPWSY